MNGIGARIRDQAELLGHFRHMRTQQGDTIEEPGEGPHQNMIMLVP